ncbi:MAG: hypothetical protein [Bacteriophage sp.]|jgi:hypothetical protein|nr:MAG: hypothetical protein [Bacteriophage sp.]
MKQSWTTGLNKELAVDVRANFKESLVLRRRLVKMLNDKINASSKEGRSKLLYDNPNWALLQADQRGYERAFAEIIDLIDEGV